MGFSGETLNPIFYISIDMYRNMMYNKREKGRREKP